MSRVLDLWKGMTGTVLPFAGTTAPKGWCLCDGSLVSRVTYARLFAAIGTTYGAGDGTTTFKLPDLRGRSVAGVDNMGGTAANRLTSAGSGVAGATLGAVGGAESVALSVSQIPAHSHEIPAQVTTAPVGSGTAYLLGAGHLSQNTFNSTGSGAAHPNVQPTMALNYIVRSL